MNNFLKFKRIFGLWLVFQAFFPLPAQVFMDESGSGASDVWEALYGPLTDPHGDDDGDGFTNLEEALAGTNPHDPNCYPRLDGIHAPNGQSVQKWFPTVPGIQYQVMASPDLQTWFPAGPAVIGDGDEEALLFQLSASVATGRVLMSRWTGLSGGGLNLVKSLAADTPPDEERSVTMLDFPQSHPNEDNYGQWIRGWLIPPHTGHYTFWLASDDHSEFWLSSDTTPENLQLHAFVEGWTAYREWTKYPAQQSPALQLQAGEPLYFEVFHREYAGGDHLSLAWTLPGRPLEEREIIAGEVLSTVGLSLDSLLEEYGRLFFRLDVGHVDSDGDGLSDFDEFFLGLNPFMARTKPRVPDLEEAIRILNSGNTVTLGVSRPRAYKSTGDPAEFVVFRAGGIRPVTVQYTVSGTATEGVDFQSLPGTIEIPGGTRAVRIPIHPIATGQVKPAESVVLTLQPGGDFELASPASATVTLDDAPDILQIATLRPLPGLVSHASGTATLRRAGNNLGSFLSLSVSGLSAAWERAELFVSDDGLSGPVILSLPAQNVSNLAWDFPPAAGLSREEILLALDQERVWARVASAAYPGGEVAGRFGHGPASPPDPFVPPAAPTVAPDAGEATRFLSQASFGARGSELQDLDSLDFAGWLDVQLALPPTHHLPYVEARRAEILARTDGDSDGWQTPRQEAFWQHALTAPDQLRQRMAFALSQILVISQFGPLDVDHVGTTLYYDMLLDHAFGNYRDLLEAVTLSPMMGTYLSMMRNQKPDPETGHEPDENYAREIMQLFSIGLVQLHPDGSPVLDAEGRPIPSYTQDETVALAHVFTGWGPHWDPNDPPRWNNGSLADPAGWFRWGRDPLRPMSFYPDFHDQEDRLIVGGVTVPGTLDGEARMAMALDALFHHPNVGPFLARNLIQRFVTSNPGPGYIQRVAEVFNDNVQGVRGDLGAVIRAILLDPEARHPAYRESLTQGKPDEPVLRMARMLRGLDLQPAKAGDPRFFLSYQYGLPEQAPLQSPSVFNFFQPVYQHPGPISDAGLLSPEFQIFSETTGIRQANAIFNALNWGIWTPEPDDEGENLVLRLDFTPWVQLLNTPDLAPAEAQNLLLDHLDALFLHGDMRPDLRQGILDAYASLPSWFDTSEERQIQRVRMALYLILTSPEAFVTR
ncbi:MAG: DUF1800 family protein [Kiritimatiellae bacterium]|nr:DUF1800 family protein [Kiritimatiellia bacterium]